MARYLFSSHDGFGLGHVRRNTLVADAILRTDPSASITVVSGLGVKPAWGIDERIDVVTVPSLLKDSDGSYRNASAPFEEVLAQRSAAFRSTVERTSPDVVVVDRHPYGIGDELRAGLHAAKADGARLILGLRDILDEPTTVRAELAGSGWRGVDELFDSVLVYGARVICDHEQEYGLDLEATYCGWVVESPKAVERVDRRLVIAAGGGGDGEDVYRLGLAVLEHLIDHEGVVIAGPYAGAVSTGGCGRVRFERDVPGCVDLFAGAGAVLQMAGYNSTFEALAAGVRPILVPRRSPRREQAIRAGRLAALGLADVVDADAAPEEVAWLVRRNRLIGPDALQRAGIDLGGAEAAARHITGLASGSRSPRSPEARARVSTGRT